ncbi:MAG: type II toxin-antitoxin system prevent-host-death family antitoxin [Spirochaetaceae bacterium]|nr:MAG: type II toxin-antitoxin system prevent-host-death family antitoxin [Spirochaetaceae bacterium]
MEVSTKELRIRPGKIIEQVAMGHEVTVTYRGKPLARIVPYDSIPSEASGESLFGMWKDRSEDLTVDEEVRELRRGRPF